MTTCSFALGSRVLEFGGQSSTDRHSTVYQGSYVEYVRTLGHEAPGIGRGSKRRFLNGNAAVRGTAEFFQPKSLPRIRSSPCRDTRLCLRKPQTKRILDYIDGDELPNAVYHLLRDDESPVRVSGTPKEETTIQQRLRLAHYIPSTFRVHYAVEESLAVWARLKVGVSSVIPSRNHQSGRRRLAAESSS